LHEIRELLVENVDINFRRHAAHHTPKQHLTPPCVQTSSMNTSLLRWHSAPMAAMRMGQEVSCDWDHESFGRTPRRTAG
jgi:hypothetical protein